MPLLPDIKSDFYTEIEVSPDGNKVVFVSTPGQISVYDFRTSALTTYPNSEVNYAYDFTWLSNGDMLLYLGTIEESWLPDARFGIYSVSLLTGKTFKVADWTDDRFQYGLHHIRLSKDDQWLVLDAARISEYYAAQDSDFVVYMLETVCLVSPQTCGESIRLVGDGHYPEWSPDGRLWWVCPQGTRSALCVAEVDSLESPQVFLTVSVLGKSADAKFYGFAWSPDGEYAAIAVKQDKPNDPDHKRSEIFLIPADGSRPVRVTAASDENEYLEGWSPNSKYLVYSQVIGYTEPQGELGGRALITDLYLYDVKTRTKFDFVDASGDREVFGFFMLIK
ncbi:MAG: PD40 domain-containing protein [Anaerolineales bacterium]|nr:PD40 domain-containing protein [Anaerolineales bacterium]